MMSDDKEKLLELPKKEQDRLQTLLYEWIRDVLRDDTWGCWSDDLKSYQGTEVEEVFDEVLIPLQEVVENADAGDIPSSMYVDEKKHKEIVEEWKNKEY